MQLIYLKKIKNLCRNYKKIKKILNNIIIINNQIIFKIFKKEYKQLNNINYLLTEWLNIKKTIFKKKFFLNNINKNNIKFKKIEKKFLINFLPNTNINKSNNCFLEIYSGTGGSEASLFSKKLFQMYYKYSEKKKWLIKIININECVYGGYKEIIFKISGNKVYDQLKFESGGHRVQRIPETESQGRIHTSTCIIAILPEVKKNEIKNINLNNIKVDTFKSSGSGGQHVNTTDSAVRITHIPTNIVVECQNERSQHKNKSKALEVLIARIKNLEFSKQKKKKSIKRKNLLGSGDRSDKKRTYNFQKDRVTDHRINLTLYCLEEIINGNLDILIKPIIKEYKIKKIYNFLNNINF
ncbi:peptide chain release factor 1 [Enterobacteriaceae bacterium ET-AT1-13]|nr:peptide chain release factor 1 [Enterobacteriaceae bacterium ET-AT1-13]